MCDSQFPSVIMRIFIYTSAILALIITFSCSDENTRESELLYQINFDTLSIKPSLKGWELYSWPNGVNWNFAILVGTNRLKDYETVTNQSLLVGDLETLIAVLSKMPEGEEIAWMSEHWLEKIWTSNYNDLMLPPDSLVQEVDRFCLEHGLVLMVAY